MELNTYTNQRNFALSVEGDQVVAVWEYWTRRGAI